jgi:hypothetical protein
VAPKVAGSNPAGHPTTPPDWIGPPRLWQRDRVLVMYLGDGAATETLLSSVLGPPFARGEGGKSPGPPVDTC